MKYQKNLKISQNFCLVLSLPPQRRILSILAKRSSEIEIELLFPVVCFFKYNLKSVQCNYLYYQIVIINNNNSTSNLTPSTATATATNNIPETRKYWVDAQWWTVSSHGDRDTL